MSYHKISYFVFILVMSGLFSCQSNDETNTVDLINIVRNGATMPAYIYGNSGSNVFVILLSGGPGAGALSYRAGSYSDLLEEQYAMVYFDQRGQGMAQGTYDRDIMTVEELAKDVDLLADALYKKYGSDISLFLMGHSWGGTLGTQVVIDSERQKKYKGWIEVDGAHDFPNMKKYAYDDILHISDSLSSSSNTSNNGFWSDIYDEISEMDPIDPDFSYLNRTAYEIEIQLATDGTIGNSDLSTLSEDFVTQIFINNPATTFFSANVSNNSLFASGLESLNLTDQLYKIEIPTLLQWGKHDYVVRVGLAYDAFEELGSAEKEIIIYERSGHSPMVTEPNEFVWDVYDFIEKYK